MNISHRCSNVTRFPLLCLLSVLVLLGMTSSSAKKPAPPTNAKKYFEQLDVNADHKLTANELSADQLNSMDANGDGTVTMGEFKTYMAKSQQKPKNNLNAVVQGTVTDNNGIALAGATINSGKATTISNADGSYTLSVTPGVSLNINASKVGCVGTFKVVSLTAGQTMPMDFSLNTIGSSTPLTNLLTTPATVTDSCGTEVNLAANTLVDSKGAAVQSATVDVTTVLPSDAKFPESFPGLFVGNKAGADADIESFGFVTIEITSSTGNTCNLAAGETADIAIPVTPGSDPGNENVDLWSLDENTGKWIFVVSATRDATVLPVVYRATVSHFSHYSLAQPIANALPFTITVMNGDGPVAGASVIIISTDKNNGAVWGATGVTGGDGTVSFSNVPQGYVAVSALFDGNQVGNGYGYDTIDDPSSGNPISATMLIKLFTALPPYTFNVIYYDIDDIQQLNPHPASYLNVAVVGTEDLVPKKSAVYGITDANGVATLNLNSLLGFPFYYIMVETYTDDGEYNMQGADGLTNFYNFIGDLPLTWVLKEVSPPPPPPGGVAVEVP